MSAHHTSLVGLHINASAFTAVIVIAVTLICHAFNGVVVGEVVVVRVADAAVPVGDIAGGVDTVIVGAVGTRGDLGSTATDVVGLHTDTTHRRLHGIRTLGVFFKASNMVGQLRF